MMYDFLDAPAWGLGLDPGLEAARGVYLSGNKAVALIILQRVIGDIQRSELVEIRSSNFAEAIRLEGYKEFALALYMLVEYEVCQELDELLHNPIWRQ